MPVTAHDFTLRPIDDLVHHLRAAGFANPRDQRVGTDDGAFHLLVTEKEPDAGALP